ncbi:MAG TPA: hypothetical protein VMT45_12940 [Thermoanaerobaculaceae bacterium]|nr:hypothetical protein [Thermoanaerobaculaceae bacterium]
MTLKVNVKGSINIKRRIVVNGKEYSSVEEMPEDIRCAYELAISGAAHEAHGIHPGVAQTRVIFNGQEYESVEEMPEDIRGMYTAAMLAVEAQGSIGFGGSNVREAPPLGERTAGALPVSMAPIEVGGGSSWTVAKVVTVALVLVIVVGAFYYLSRLLLPH